MTVARKPGHRGELGVSRNPPRRESRLPPLNLYARVRFCWRILHTRPRVQRAPGFPCALCFERDDISFQNSGASRREDADLRPTLDDLDNAPHNDVLRATPAARSNI